ncbi:MAG: hypothetical protein WC799_21070 [Desulfobacteraceae bacterium]|jgi:hypothetical protein
MVLMGQAVLHPSLGNGVIADFYESELDVRHNALPDGPVFIF